jgi:hypothetical protein
MDQNTVLTIFVIVSAIALLLQLATLFGLFVVARKLQQAIIPMIPQIQGIIGTTRRTVDTVSTQIEKIGNTSSAILDVTKQRVHKIDDLLNDATSRAKVQMDRAEMVLDDSMTRVQQTVTAVQSGVLRPVREVYGVFTGLRTALAYLGRPGRATVDHATSDEEMFI